MHISWRSISSFSALRLIAAFALGYNATAQGTSGTIQGTVVANAKVEIHDPVSRYHRDTTTDGAGAFKFNNVPFRPYQIVVTAKEFAPFTQEVEVRSVVPVGLEVSLKLATASTKIEVRGDAAKLIDRGPTAQTPIARELFDTLSHESPSSGFSSVVGQASQGNARDSNGQIHGIGDHASISTSFDGVPDTNQFSRIFSNPISLASVQSLEVSASVTVINLTNKVALYNFLSTFSATHYVTPRTVTAEIGFHF